MLEYLRNASEKPIAKILIGILSFSFIGWGVAEWIFGGASRDTTLVYVGNAEIGAQQFSNEKSRQLSFMPREQQRTIYTDPAEMKKFTDSVMQQLAHQKMLETRAQDLGVVISDHRIAEEIRIMPDFQTGGRFSSQMFDAVLANAGYTEDMFADYLRSQMLRNAVMGPVASPVEIPNFATVATYNARYAVRDIEYVSVPFYQYKIDTPTDEQLRAYYSQNPQTVAEVRNVSYVLIPAKMEQPDSYEAGFANAQRVEDEIIAGESLANAASHHGATFVNVGALKLDTNAFDDVINSAMISRVFSMDEGTESELIETKTGFVIVRVDKIFPEHSADFNDVKNSLVSDWIRSEQKKQAYVAANGILVDAKKGKDMTNKTMAKVTRTGGAPVDVLSAAFNKDLETISLVEGADAFYVLRIMSESMPAVDNTKMASIKTELENMSGRGIADDYDAFLKRLYPVKVNDKVYNRYFAK